MKTIRSLGLALVAIGTLALAASPAFAAGGTLCSPMGSNASGSKRIVNPNTSTAYTLNGRGCAYIAAADMGWFASQGYTPLDNAVVALQLLKAGSVILPAGAYIEGIIVQETSAAAV